MLDFMDRVQNAFYAATGWNVDNSYARLNESARALLDFPLPTNLTLSLSSLSTPHSGASYTLCTPPSLTGSLSYLYSSLPLTTFLSPTATTPLPSSTPGYRQLLELAPPIPSSATFLAGESLPRIQDQVLFGRMLIPKSQLEALYMRRLGSSGTGLLRVAGVSSGGRRGGKGTVLVTLTKDTGKWCSEGLYGTDVGLLGWRGLYNFGRDPRKKPVPVGKLEGDRPVGRFSAGVEVYYGVLNKSAGMSTGLRYTTLPTHPGIPLTMTITLNPLMGHIAATYAVRAGETASFASRFEFNMYSYESDLVIGGEIWRRKSRREWRTMDRAAEAALEDGAIPLKPAASKPLVDMAMSSNTARQVIFSKDGEMTEEKVPLVGGDNKLEGEDLEGVLKARINQKGELGLLWEGRVKELLFSVGGKIDCKNAGTGPGNGFMRSIGLEVQYSS